MCVCVCVNSNFPKGLTFIPILHMRESRLREIKLSKNLIVLPELRLELGVQNDFETSLHCNAVIFTLLFNSIYLLSS